MKRLIVFFSMSVTLFSQQLIYPDIPLNFINDLTFVSDSVGYFINNSGSICTTTDGGKTWEIQSHYQRNYLKQVEFINQNSGFVWSPYAFIGDDISFLYSHKEFEYLYWSKADIKIGDVVTFLPLSENKIIKSDNYGRIMMLDNFYGQWELTYEMPGFQGGCIYFPNGEITQFYNFKNHRILALCNNSYALSESTINDSATFILESLDDAYNWDTLWIGLSDIMHSFTFVNDSIGWMVGENTNIYKTNDGGKSWEIKYSDSLNNAQYYYTNISAIDTNYVVTSNNFGTVFSSSNGGSTWNKKTFQTDYEWENKVYSKNENETIIYGSDLLRTLDGGRSWQSVSKSLKTYFYQTDFINDSLGWAISSLGILNTKDGGRSWNIQYSTRITHGSRSIQMIDSLDGWAIANKNLLHTLNGGLTWTDTTFADLSNIRGLTFLDKNIGIIYEYRKNTDDDAYNLVTTDGGITWKEYIIEDENQPSNLISSFTKMKFSDSKHLWFVNQQGIWLSQDTAKTWNIVNSEISCFEGFDFFDSLTAFVAFDHKTMAFTKDGCKTWEFVDNPYPFQTIDIEIIGQTHQGLLITACGYDGTIVNYYYENGFDFVRTIPSYTNEVINDAEVLIKNNRPHIWWSGQNSTVIYRLSEFLVTDVNSKMETFPNMFRLSQNYPNPFNPTTTIEYYVPSSSVILSAVKNLQDFSSQSSQVNRSPQNDNYNISLRVYDILGREVKTLVNQPQNPGKYSVQFDASKLSSGIYYYQLTADSFIQTKKMILLK